MVPIKMADLASFIAAKKNMAVSDAICYLYNSEFVAKLYDEESKWWYLDNETLYELMEQERRNNSVDFSAQKAQFVIFCIECYARKHRQSGLEVFVRLQEPFVKIINRNNSLAMPQSSSLNPGPSGSLLEIGCGIEAFPEIRSLTSPLNQRLTHNNR